jgi:hypothetical protein
VAGWLADAEVGHSRDLDFHSDYRSFCVEMMVMMEGVSVRLLHRPSPWEWEAAQRDEKA